jgi:hypothetical protein
MNKEPYENMTREQAYDILTSFADLWIILDPEEKERLRQMEREVMQQEKESQKQEPER